MDHPRFSLDEYERHPKAIPMPAPPEWWYHALRDGIRAHGLRIPIRVQRDTHWVIDGWYRLQACRDLLKQGADIIPKFEEVDIADDDVAITTACEASKRPGLSRTQKALMALAVLPDCELRARKRQELGTKLGQGEEKGKAAAEAARLVGAGRSYVEQLMRIRRDHPDIFERIDGVKFDLQAAHREAAGKPRRGGAGETSKPIRVPPSVGERFESIRRDIGIPAGDFLKALLDLAEACPDEWLRLTASLTHAEAA